MRSDHVAVSGNGRDMIRDRAISRLESLGTDTIGVQRVYAVPNSGPIALSRADGTRPASHVKGAWRISSVAPHSFDAVTVTRVFQQGGVGLPDAIDGAPHAAQMQHAGLASPASVVALEDTFAFYDNCSA